MPEQTDEPPKQAFVPVEPPRRRPGTGCVSRLREYPDGVSPKKKAIAACLREHPGVTGKPLIARELQMDRSTAHRYCDEIRAEFRERG